MYVLRKWLLLLFAASAAHAQPPPLRARIPFDFIVNGKTLPAGEYRVGRFMSASAFSVSSEETKQTASFLTSPVHSPSGVRPATLIFHRYGRQYFLYQVWTDDPHYGVEVPKSKLERELIARKEVSNDITVATR